MGNVYYSLGQYHEAIDFYQQSLKIAREIGDRFGEANSLGNLGNVYHCLGRYIEASDFHQQSLKIKREIGDRFGEATCLGNLGSVHNSLGRYSEASDYHQQSLKIKREIGDRRGEASSLGGLGNVCYCLGQYSEASDYHQQSLKIKREIGDRFGEASSLGGLGNVCYCLGQYSEASAYHQQSLNIAREIGDRFGEANSLGDLGNAYQCLGQYSEAIDYHQQSLEIKRKIGDRGGEANSLGNLGNAYHSLGQYQEAIDFLQQSLNIAREIGDRKSEANSLGNLGNAYHSLGQYQQAIDFLQQFLNIAREIGDRRGEASSLGNLGSAYDSLGRYQEAIAHYQQQLNIAREIGDRGGEASSLGNLGNAYHSLGQYQEAIDYHQQSLNIAREIGVRQGEAASLGNLGNAYYSLGRYQEAIDYQQQSLNIKREIGDRRGEATSLGNLGAAYLSLGRYNEAIQTYQEALKICTPSSFPVESIFVGRNLGDTAFKAKQYSEAIVGYEAAIEAVEMRCSWESSETGKRQLREGALDIYEKMMLSCIYTEQFDKALETVERSKSRNLVELFANAELYPEGASEELKQQLKQLRRRIAAAQQLLEQVDSNIGAGFAENPPSSGQRLGATSPLSSDSLQQQRQILQESQQQLNELLNQIQQIDPKFTLTQRVEPIGIAKIRNLIDDKTAILEWYVGTAGFYAFIVTGDKLYVEQFDSNALQHLETWKSEYLEDYNPQPIAGESEEIYQQRRQQLQKNWIDRLDSRLAQLAEILRLNDILAKIPLACQQLILIPHRYLHLFPLHALEGVRENQKREKKSGNLLDLFPAGVRYAPSCQLLQQVQIRQPEPIESRLLFAIQNPTLDLTYTDVEVEAIQRSFNPNHVLPREKATKTALTENLNILRRAYYAHFSCHGAFNFQYPLLSSLVLAEAYESIASEEPQPQTPTSPAETEKTKQTRYLALRNGRQANPEKCLTLREIFASLDLPHCRLVTLSACETGLIDSRQFIDEPIGLSSGFLYAGSLNVISSLWWVDDLATAFLMIKCYDNLSTAPSVAVALNSAQSWLRQVNVQELRDWIDELNIDAGYKQNLLDELELFNPGEIRFAKPFYWAAFCAIGQ